ncbi:hypothetical protein, partial [uncultured Pseudoflavonifractor sp.]|uniref:hypothetical protein n=1 Tax=uncultured Pseudoflavonifractor sp. TaxID=1221379 RepID=UPI0025E73193
MSPKMTDFHLIPSSADDGTLRGFLFWEVFRHAEGRRNFPPALFFGLPSGGRRLAAGQTDEGRVLPTASDPLFSSSVMLRAADFSLS